MAGRDGILSWPAVRGLGAPRAISAAARDAAREAASSARPSSSGGWRRRRSRRTSAAAIRWTRPAPTASREARSTWSGPSAAPTPTSSACPWRSCWRCSMRRSGAALGFACEARLDGCHLTMRGGTTPNTNVPSVSVCDRSLYTSTARNASRCSGGAAWPQDTPPTEGMAARNDLLRKRLPSLSGRTDAAFAGSASGVDPRALPARGNRPFRPQLPSTNPAATFQRHIQGPPPPAPPLQCHREHLSPISKLTSSAYPLRSS